MAEQSLGRLLALAGRDKPRFLAACGLTLAGTALTVAPFLLAAAIIQQWTVHGTVAPLLPAAVAACLVAQPAVSAAASGIAHMAAFDLLFTVRRDLVEKLTRLPQSAFTRQGTAATKRVLVEEVEALELFLSHQMPDVLACVTVPLATLATLAVVDWRLALACLAVLPLVMAAQTLMMRGHGARMGEYFGRIGAINGAVAEYVRGIEVVKGLAGGSLLFDGIRRRTGEFRAFAEGWFGQWGPPWSLYVILTAAAPLVVLPLGLLLAERGALPLGDLVFGLFAATGLGTPLVKLTVYGEITLRVQQAERKVRETMDTPDLAAPAVATMAPADATLAFKDVSYAADGRPLVRNVSFSAPAGGLTAIVGPSGAGKTTLLRLAGRALDPTGGHITLGGVPLSALPAEALARHIGVVSQEVFLFDDTVEANIRFGRPEAGDEAVRAAARQAHCEAFIADLPDGYATRLGEGGRRLSGGQRQRLGLARALLAGAPVLLLDEATAFADPWHEAQLQGAVNGLVGAKTVIVVSHRLDSVTGADRIVFLRDGRVEGCGSHDALVGTCPGYAALWRTQCRNLEWSVAE